MPLYRFKNPETGEEVEVFQSMKDDHSYSENGIDYERVFLIPNASIDAKIDGLNPDYYSYTLFVFYTIS